MGDLNVWKRLFYGNCAMKLAQKGYYCNQQVFLYCYCFWYRVPIQVPKKALWKVLILFYKAPDWIDQLIKHNCFDTVIFVKYRRGISLSCFFRSTWHQYWYECIPSSHSPSEKKTVPQNYAAVELSNLQYLCIFRKRTSTC